MSTENKEFWYEKSWVLLVTNLLIPPLGLVLLGNAKKISLPWKCTIALSLYILIACIAWVQFPPFFASKTDSPSTFTNTIQYANISFEEVSAITTPQNLVVKPAKDEFFLKVNFQVSNEGSEEYFYISHLDQPYIYSSDGERLYFDATISMDPFGNIEPKEILSGFFLFRIPTNFNAQSFLIQGSSFFIPEEVTEKKRNAS
ncbi:MAG: hypothetical protein PHX86_06850 [Caldisericia bacterium]|nr:hypothetical protein [Caldisericia bacterium]